MDLKEKLRWKDVFGQFVAENVDLNTSDFKHENEILAPWQMMNKSILKLMFRASSWGVKGV